MLLPLKCIHSMWKTGGWAGLKFELYTYKDVEGNGVERLFPLNQGVFRIWLDGKNDQLRGRSTMPSILSCHVA